MGLRGLGLLVLSSARLEKMGRKENGVFGWYMQVRGKTNLIVQHKEQGTTHTQVPWPLYLEPICLLGCGCPMPLSGAGGKSRSPTDPSGLMGLRTLGGSSVLG